jgi:hypothetical protein
MAANARAQVTMAVSNNGGPPGGGFFASDYSSLFTATLSGYTNPNTGNNQIIAGDDLIGIYQFTVTPGGTPTLSSPFYATCISPAGQLTTGNFTYNEETFAQAEPGHNPNAWAGANPVNGGYGIQNANYLYQLIAPGIISGAGPNGDISTYNDEGAAMALAMYTVLYNSTGYGAYNNAFGGPGPFQITGGLSLSSDPGVYSDYETYLGDVSGMTSDQAVTGGVLVPEVATSQDMILIGGAVPEPTTIIAGALLLLPFGASTIRVLRRNRAA